MLVILGVRIKVFKKSSKYLGTHSLICWNFGKRYFFFIEIWWKYVTLSSVSSTCFGRAITFVNSQIFLNILLGKPKISCFFSGRACMHDIFLRTNRGVCLSPLVFLPFTQKIFRQPIPENLWPYSMFFYGCTYDFFLNLVLPPPTALLGHPLQNIFLL